MIGIIGGSGLEDPRLIENYKEIEVETPWGKPSSKIVVGEISGKKVCILSRHGPKHSVQPTNVPYRANIWALKQQGCKVIMASSACGSLREDIKPGDFVFVNQFFDMTRHRNPTFFDKDKVSHIPMAEPFCPQLRSEMIEAAKELKLKHHANGTVITIEGPRFSTKAESKVWRQWQCDVVNMSTVPEVVLARELGLCYQTVCMSTDYDCWHEAKEGVDIQTVLKVFKENAEKMKKLFIAAVPKIADARECVCEEDAKNAQLC